MDKTRRFVLFGVFPGEKLNRRKWKKGRKYEPVGFRFLPVICSAQYHIFRNRNFMGKERAGE